MTKHTAKKVATGVYNYRGWKVENMRYVDSTCNHWNLTAPTAMEAEDSAATLGQAKEMVDFWMSRGLNK